MSNSPDNPKLDPCGCCQSPSRQPQTQSNRPGQPALAYRIGTHSSFLRRMLARLPGQSIPGGPNQGNQPLTAFTTRNSDDPTVAILDAWATVADVLTFYQERIANEGYLRTATQRRSVLELARSIGYELNPGVAASAYLAFTVEDAPGAPKMVKVPQGTQVQSVPVPPELPQTFETDEEIEARGEWNALKPQTKKRQELGPGTKDLYLKGVNTGLTPGDAILFVGEECRRTGDSGCWAFRILQSVTPKEDYTLVAWKEGLDELGAEASEYDDVLVYALRQRAALCCHISPQPAHESANDSITLDAVYPKILVDSWLVLEGWPHFVKESVRDDSNTIPRGLFQVKRVETAPCAPFPSTDSPVQVQATFLQLGPNLAGCSFDRHRTVVFAQSEKLKLADVSLTEPLASNRIELDLSIARLTSGRMLIVSGKGTIRPDPTVAGDPLIRPDGLRRGEPASGQKVHGSASPQENGVTFSRVAPTEFDGSAVHFVRPALALRYWRAAEEAGPVAEVVRVEHTKSSDDGKRTVILLQEPLEYSYDPATVTIHANVVRATHGETVSEVQGSGDGSLANQQFKLKKPPLTYVSASTSSGSRSSLELRVNGLLWQEKPSLYGLAPHDEAYIVRHENSGTTRVVFGDGQSGARLPTGMENVTARYRSGIGPAGEVAAESLTLLKTRPFGIRELTNPLPAAGAAGPERLDEARTNAPRTVLTFDRIVSLQDFEDFARGFTGIGKAMAVPLWNGERRIVHITVATASGKFLSLNPDLYNDLVKAIRQACEPTQRFHVDDYDPQQFCLGAAVKIDAPRYVSQDVLAEVEAALSNAYSFEHRELGQAVTAAELATVIQAVPGVIAVQLRQLHLQDGQPGPEHERPPAVLPAAMAQWNEDEGQFQPAQLLTLMSGGVTLSEMESIR